MSEIEKSETSVSITVSRPSGDRITGTVTEVLSQLGQDEVTQELATVLRTLEPFIQRALMNTRDYRQLQRLESAIGSLTSARDHAQRSAAIEYGID